MIGLVAHSQKPAAACVVRAMADGLERLGIPFVLEDATAPLAGRSSGPDLPQMAGMCSLLVVMGGDGTILRVVHKLGETLPPIFGINIGSLGFLTCLGPTEIALALESIRNRDYILSPRPLLETSLYPARGEARTYHGLNETLVGRGERSELVKIRVRVGGVPLTVYHADGLVVATPTGSTAYSLSAGGPILMPDSGGFVVTPICPHVLTNRSVVVSDQSDVEVEVAEAGPVVVTIDGQESSPMEVGDTLRIRKSARCLPLAMLPGRSFSEVLRQKLKWTGSNI